MARTKHKEICCAVCHKGNIRLYRPYGSFFQKERVRCNEHIKNAHAYYIPCVISDTGEPWGYTSIPPKDIIFWSALPEASTQHPLWIASESLWRDNQY